MREIGSEFWDVPVTNQQTNLFPEFTQWYLSGRSALQAIIKPFADAGFSIDFYPVFFEDGKLVQEVAMDSDVLFLMDYFGYVSSNPDLSGYKGIVIRDITHSIFSITYSDADYYFGSLRKWCGVWTGGYAWTREGHGLHTEASDDSKYVLLREKAMQQKAEYINGQRGDKCYLKIFDEAEELLESVGSIAAAVRDVEIAKKIDIETIKRRRRINAEVIRSAFPDWLIFPDLSPTDVPMFVPVLIPDGRRDELRRFLIKNEIYCPIHWPVSEYHRLDEKTIYIYQNELSLVCDQRYTEDDMARMVETIKLFMED